MNEIQMDIIQPTLREEIATFLRSRIRWRSIGICMETMSKLLLGSTSVLAFATSIYPCNSYLSFIAGTVSTLSLVSLQFANYSFRESKMSTDNLNTLLKKMEVSLIPHVNGSVLEKQSPSIQLEFPKELKKIDTMDTTLDTTVDTKIDDTQLVSTDVLNRI